MTRTVFLSSLFVSAWLGMQLVHELGRAVGAWATGGRVQKLVFHPLAISRTDVAPNPHPLVVAWAGPMMGMILPALVAAGFPKFWRRGRAYAAFVAGFCLISNGLYIGVGSFEGVGDAGDLLRLGVRQEILLLLGATASLLGVWIWHCVSSDFGFGKDPRIIGRNEATLAATAAAILTVLAAAFGARD